MLILAGIFFVLFLLCMFIEWFVSIPDSSLSKVKFFLLAICLLLVALGYIWKGEVNV